VLKLRRAEPVDEAFVLALRNESSTRASSFSTDEVGPEEHHRWFTRKLFDPDCALLIVEVDGIPVGQVRLDRVAQDIAEVSIGLAPEARGRGLGRESLRQAVLEARRLLFVTSLRALVKRQNAASLAAFAAAGFDIVGEDHDAVELLHAQVDPSTG